MADEDPAKEESHAKRGALRPPPSEGVVSLVFTGPDGAAKEVSLKPGIYLLGRTNECQIRFPASAVNVSRTHAQLTVEPGSVLLEDLESSAGTMVNGRVVRKKTLEHEDVISIGGNTLKVRLLQQKLPPKDSTLLVLADSRSKTLQGADDLERGLNEVAAATRKLVREVGKRIVGQAPVIRAIWATILARGHCLLVGVPGLAKTLMVSTFAEVTGLQTKRIQFTPDLMPSDILGSNVIHETEDRKRYFEFVQGPVFTQLLLADEINRTPPKTQAALLEAMQERQVTIGNKSLTLPEPFCVIATQNPIEQEGTYPLPEAQQDRFLACILLDYPGKKEEVDILLQTTGRSPGEVDRVFGYEDILRFQDVVSRVSVSRRTATYVTEIVRATRPSGEGSPDWLKRIVDWGAGPRAGQSILRVARAIAAMDGRPAICEEDVHEIVVAALRHRISCNYRARTEGLTPDAVVERIVAEASKR